MKIELPIFSRSKKKWKAVEGEIIDVAPHLANWTFAVHRPLDEDFWMGPWAVSNIETGGRISFGDGRRDAILKAAERLSTKNHEEVTKAAKALLAANKLMEKAR